MISSNVVVLTVSLQTFIKNNYFKLIKGLSNLYIYIYVCVCVCARARVCVRVCAWGGSIIVCHNVSVTIARPYIMNGKRVMKRKRLEEFNWLFPIVPHVRVSTVIRFLVYAHLLSSLMTRSFIRGHKLWLFHIGSHRTPTVGSLKIKRHSTYTCSLLLKRIQV